MAGLSVAHRVALAAVLERCSETMLGAVTAAVAPLAGGRAAELRMLLAEEARDRARRNRVMAPIAPMFRARPDGVEAMTFPAPVLARLWKAAAAKEPALLPRLDRNDMEAVAVADRICQAAAAVTRDQSDLIWPGDGDSEARERGLEDLAACLDLAHLARRGLPSLEIWLKRPDGDQIAELRLLLKDCAGIHIDGARRMLEILFAHLEDAVLILRILTQASSVAERETFLCDSELAGFIDRLIDGVDIRAASIAAFRPGADPAGVKAVIADLGWCASVLGELDVTLTLNPQSVWGKSVRDGRVAIAGRLGGFLRQADKAVSKALPLTRVQLAGRMTRTAPLLTAPAQGEAVEAARSLLKLVGAVRGAASTFGCEADRKALVEALTERLTEYADQAIHAVNDGEAEDEDHALKLVETAAGFLDLIDAREAARTVRRRAAVASAPSKRDEASSRAA